MIRLGLVSDSHGQLANMEQAALQLAGCDALCHMGDTAQDGIYMAQWMNVPLYVVSGNCDGWSANAPAELTVEIGGFRLLLCHGNRYGVKQSFTRLNFRARAAQADIVLYGHTHVPQVDHDGSILFVNPGALMSGRFAILEFRPNGPVPVMKIL